MILAVCRKVYLLDIIISICKLAGLVKSSMPLDFASKTALAEWGGE